MQALPRKTASEDAEGTLRLSDIAYRKVLEGLFDRTVPAGAFVSQNDLVNLLGVPVQPLRDALRVLEAEGVLTIHPRSGVQFLKPDLELARSTYQFRTIIERVAARTFAESGDAKVIAKLTADHERLMADIKKRGFSREMMERLDVVEDRMHGEIIDSLRNPLIKSTARRLKNYVRLIQLERLVTQPLALRTLKEHLEILKAVAARDADAAENAVAVHFQAAMQRILGIF